MANTTSSCACGSGLSLNDCCLPFIQGKKKPTTAEQLLRARYTAFATQSVDYVLSSHHSKTIKDVKREEIEEWSNGSEWLGLKIVQKEAGEATDQQGTIVFCAQYKTKEGQTAGKTQDHWEQAYFEKEAGDWKFLDARGIHTGPYRRQEPKIGRNDPCHCGSGQKFKKCHGAA